MVNFPRVTILMLELMELVVDVRFLRSSIIRPVGVWVITHWSDLLVLACVVHLRFHDDSFRVLVSLLSVKTRWACGDADRQSEDEGKDCGREDDQQADDRPPTKSPRASSIAGRSLSSSNSAVDILVAFSVCEVAPVELVAFIVASLPLMVVARFEVSRLADAFRSAPDLVETAFVVLRRDRGWGQSQNNGS